MYKMTFQTNYEVPFGISLIRKASDRCCPRTFVKRILWYRASVFILTYAGYTCYHLSRKPISVVKNVLNQNCSNDVPPPDLIINDSNKDNWCDWAPFGDTNSATLLGALDSAYLFSYAASMFLSGFVAERVNLRYFLALGMITSGIFTYLFGLAKSYGIHYMWYFTLVQILSGVVQSTGWPGVVTVIGNWFGRRKRGIIFGLWNSHTSMGNILGSLIAGEYVENDWSLSFIVPGILIAVMGFVIFLFLVVRPVDVDCPLPDQGFSELPSFEGYEKVPADDPSDHLVSYEADDTEILADQIVPEDQPRPDHRYMFRNCASFYGEELLAPCPIPKLEDHSLSAVHDCLFNIFVATLHVGGHSSIHNLGML